MFWPFANTWRFRSIFNKGLKRRLNSLRRRSWLFGSGITIEATDRDDGRFQCQLEQLEPKKVLDADFDLTGGVLTITLDDDSQSIAFTPTSALGNYTFTLGGVGNVFNGTDGGGLTGDGTNALTISSAATIDTINVTTNASITSGDFTFESGAPGETIDDLIIDVDGVVVVNTLAKFSGTASLDVVGGSDFSVGIGAGVNITSPGGFLNITPDIQAPFGPTLQADFINVHAINNYDGSLGLTGNVTIAGAVTRGGAITVTGNLTTTAAGIIDAPIGGSLTVTGETSLGADVDTSGSQTYSGDFAITADVTLQAYSSVTFGASIDGNGNGLTVDLTGSTTINGDNVTN
ncbi:MAG: hypothetical protein EBZ13_09235, partial [Planctomycetia bacterium]|nr:hypothetical protein [Planctomycetia bacterium]